MLPLLLIVWSSKTEAQQNIFSATTYDNGAIKEIKYHNKTKDRIELVKGETYYSSGNKESEGDYLDGKKDDLWTFWWENGRKKSEGVFNDGILDGILTSWSPDGKENFELTWKFGYPWDGKRTEWYESGQKMSEGTWKNGKPDGLWAYWEKDGQKYIGKTTKEDGEDGSFLFFYDGKNTTVKSHQTYKDGKQDGKWTSWDENGQKSEGTLKDGKPDGLWTLWYDNGEKEEEGTYKEGEKDG